MTDQPARTAAQAIAAAMQRQGLTSQASQADVMGVHRVQWNRYLNGHQSPSTAKVTEWLEAARNAGHDLRLVCGPDGWTVDLPSDPATMVGQAR